MDIQRISLAEAASGFLAGELPSGETVSVDIFFDVITETSPVISAGQAEATEIGTSGLYYWCLDNLDTTPSADMEILWRMKSGSTGRTYLGHLIIGGYTDVPKENAAALVTIEGKVDDILEDTDTTIPDLIGSPVALDGALATLSGMLTKMADDNGGADFDAATDSLQAIADGESTAPTVTQIREEMDANSTQLAAIVEDTDDIVTKLETGSLEPNSVKYE